MPKQYESNGVTVQAIRYDGGNAAAVTKLTGLPVNRDIYNTVTIKVGAYPRLLTEDTWVVQHPEGRTELMNLTAFISRYSRSQ